MKKNDLLWQFQESTTSGRKSAKEAYVWAKMIWLFTYFDTAPFFYISFVIEHLLDHRSASNPSPKLRVASKTNQYLVEKENGIV